jgi:hypothetical protein
MTRISREAHVEAPFSATLDFAEQIVTSRRALYLSPSPPFGQQVRFAAAGIDDTTDGARKHHALLLAWRPQNIRMFPEFRGVLTIRPHHRGATLIITGEYEPPSGIAGRLFDAALGRTIARRTMDALLGEFRTEIEREYEAERSSRATSVP